ncbi:hypothetical protein sr14692 [Sporisorium reilianum SRZ2]|uniref:Uncharacterized protein n=1 Tax=Sporisorium reilianum (strain SRZ2) TaxID=999809 RepID=E6ZME5_SPORE|nr:hypothetical protein sr14692 [Sporisorium reilianum SRZ2]
MVVSANGSGHDAAPSATGQPDIFKFGSLRYRYTPAVSPCPGAAHRDENGETNLATEPEDIKKITLPSAFPTSKGAEPEHKREDRQAEGVSHREQSQAQSAGLQPSLLAVLRQTRLSPLQRQTPGIIRLNTALQPNLSPAPRFETFSAAHRSHSTPPASSSQRQAPPLNPNADSFDMPTMAKLSLADQPVAARQGNPSTAVGTSVSASAHAHRPSRLSEPTGRDAYTPRKETLVNQLKRKRAPPPQGVWQDPYYIFARFGKAGEVAPLVITENEHMRQSLISERAAKKLRDRRHASKGKQDGHPADRWIVADVSWPYDAAHPDARPAGSLDYFLAKQVRFLIVPRIEMTNGIILARNELQSRNLVVTKGPFRPCLAVDGRRELGIVLHSFPAAQLELTATDQPFRQLCHLAEFAVTRKLQKKKRQAFHDNIAQEAREDKLRDQARRSRDKQRSSGGGGGGDTDQAQRE